MGFVGIIIQTALRRKSMRPENIDEAGIRRIGLVVRLSASVICFLRFRAGGFANDCETTQ